MIIQDRDIDNRDLRIQSIGLTCNQLLNNEFVELAIEVVGGAVTTYCSTAGTEVDIPGKRPRTDRCAPLL